ncbi:hypothetical protein CDAR_594621 [Caerostris darwini]|uniref:Uncharacterized protein n=1 Tax=Caerostris darwini TaxID=1538125 RepID=A0AAV4WV36_9ARAC|nr:hypothetical protein CDAR_594621 [Caerostris darwini]
MNYVKRERVTAKVNGTHRRPDHLTIISPTRCYPMSVVSGPKVRAALTCRRKWAKRENIRFEPRQSDYQRTRNHKLRHGEGFFSNRRRKKLIIETAEGSSFFNQAKMNRRWEGINHSGFAPALFHKNVLNGPCQVERRCPLVEPSLRNKAPKSGKTFSLVNPSGAEESRPEKESFFPTFANDRRFSGSRRTNFIGGDIFIPTSFFPGRGKKKREPSAAKRFFSKWIIQCQTLLISVGENRTFAAKRSLAYFGRTAGHWISECNEIRGVYGKWNQ